MTLNLLYGAASATASTFASIGSRARRWRVLRENGSMSCAGNELAMISNVARKQSGKFITPTRVCRADGLHHGVDVQSSPPHSNLYFPLDECTDKRATSRLSRGVSSMAM